MSCSVETEMKRMFRCESAYQYLSGPGCAVLLRTDRFSGSREGILYRPL